MSDIETENRCIWFTAFVGDAMGRLDKPTGEVVVYPNPPSGGFVAEDTIDSDGNIRSSTADQKNPEQA